MPPICCRAGALEELEQARHDVDGHAGVAAYADGVQQVVVAGAREGDHHAIDAAEGDQVRQRVQRAETRDAEAARLLHVIVDVADGLQAELGVTLEPLHELQGDVAGAEDQRSLAQSGRAVQRHARGGTPGGCAAPGDHDGQQRARDRPSRVEQRQQAVDRPGDQQRRDREPGCVSDATRPRAQVIQGVQPADVGEHRPGKADCQRHDRYRLEREASGQRGERPCQRPGDDVRREQLASQLRLTASCRGVCGYERLSEDVCGDAQGPSRICRCGVRAQELRPSRSRGVMPRISECQSLLSGLSLL